MRAASGVPLLPLHKRNDLLHVDAFPSRPTRGDRILRVFTNLSPDKPRVWLTTDRFGALAPRTLRSRPLRFHDSLKENAAFQAGCIRTQLEFPPPGTWLVFSDGVPHAVLSGQFALEQTLLIPPSALVAAQSSPLRVLEALCGRSLAG